MRHGTVYMDPTSDQRCIGDASLLINSSSFHLGRMTPNASNWREEKEKVEENPSPYLVTRMK